MESTEILKRQTFTSLRTLMVEAADRDLDHRYNISDLRIVDDALQFELEVIRPEHTKRADHLLKCGECGKQFVATNAYAQVCSGACRMRKQRREARETIDATQEGS